MKTKRFNLVVLTVAMFTLAARAEEEDIVTNRLSFSARLGFNISARFKGVNATPIGPPRNPRSTPSQPGRPNGDPYNYDDGYVLTDVSENYGDQTWYWGYDSSSQISGNTILLSRTTRTTAGGATGSFDDDPSLGCELTYNRLLGVKGDARYGLEVAVNYLNLSLHANDTYRGAATRETYAYPFTQGTTPPGTATGPYQGSFTGPGFVIGDTPVGRPSTVPVPGSFTQSFMSL